MAKKEKGTKVEEPRQLSDLGKKILEAGSDQLQRQQLAYSIQEDHPTIAAYLLQTVQQCPLTVQQLADRA